MTWATYCNQCEKLTDERLSYAVLTYCVPFYKAYKAGVKPSDLMSLVNAVGTNERLKPNTRLKRINNLIEQKEG